MTFQGKCLELSNFVLISCQLSQGGPSPIVKTPEVFIPLSLMLVKMYTHFRRSAGNYFFCLEKKFCSVSTICVYSDDLRNKPPIERAEVSVPEIIITGKQSGASTSQQISSLIQDGLLKQQDMGVEFVINSPSTTATSVWHN